MREFLACYDYGQGGIWLYVEGESASDITTKYPALTIVDVLPPWWNEEFERLVRSHNPATSPFWAEWLSKLKTNS